MNSAVAKLARTHTKRSPIEVGDIVDTVELPTRSRVPSLPFGDMDVGHSFPVTGIGRVTIAKQAKQYDGKFRIDIDPRKIGEFRVWRTA